MNETIALVKGVISYSSMFFVLCSLVGVAIFTLTKDQAKLRNRYKLLMPLYYMFFASFCFCGILLLTFRHFDLNLIDTLAILASLIILYTSIKTFTLSKKGTMVESFKNFSQKKYISDIILCIGIFLLSVFG